MDGTKEIFEEICTTKDWVFEYGRKDFLNLYDGLEVTGKIHLFVEPAGERKNRSDSGTIESRTYSGFISILVSSDLDELTYEDRYQQHIKLLVKPAIEEMEELLRCTYEVNIESTNETEVVNVFDYNLDGVLYNYQMTIEED